MTHSPVRFYEKDHPYYETKPICCEHQNLSLKNTLTAEDARIVEEQF